MRISDYSVEHPAVIAMVLVVVLVFGLLAVTSLSQEMFAEVNMPSVNVITIYPGASPRDVEREVTNVLEEELAVLSGVTAMSSSSLGSVSFIAVEFGWNADLDAKVNELREKINNTLGRLPDGILGPPTFLKMSSNALPVLTYVVDSDLSRENLSRFVDQQVTGRLNRISGVAKVDVHSIYEKNVVIEVDIDQLAVRQIALVDILKLLKHSNLSFPAGDVVFKNEQLNIRSQGEFKSLEEVENLVVGYKDQAPIRLRDVARVEFREKDRKSYTVSRAKEQLVIDIHKQQGADTIEIAASVAALLAQLGREFGDLAEFRVVADQSRDTAMAINSVKNSAIGGAVLAVIVLLLFLNNMRTTVIIGLSIPFSILITFLAMKVNGQSLNLMTLGGITVGIGMIVDSSIVVLENIHKRFEESHDPKAAAKRGVGEVGGAVVASTATSLAVFVPILFVSGFTGVILRDVAWAIVFALGGSLVVSLVVVPFLAALLMVDGTSPKWAFLGRLKAFGDRQQSLLGRLNGAYQGSLDTALSHPSRILIASALTLVVAFLLFRFVGFEFIPETDMNEVEVSISTPPGYTLDRTKRKVELIESIVHREVPEIEEALFYIGTGSSFALTTNPSRAYARIRLVKNAARDRDVFEIIGNLRRVLAAEVPDAEIQVTNGGLGAIASMAVGGAGFQIEISGHDMDGVYDFAQAVKVLMKEDPEIDSVEVDVNKDRREMVSRYLLDQMGLLGVTPYEAAVTNRLIFNGMEAGRFRDAEGSTDMVLRSSLAGGRITPDVMDRITIRSLGGSFVSLSNLADLDLEPTLSGINHRDRLPSVVVTGLLRGSDVRGVSSRITRGIGALVPPPGVQWAEAGASKQMMSSFLDLLFALGISVFLVYTVMVIQFERFLQPLVVMASVPFTLIGVVLSLLLFGSSLSIISFMGVITLAGVVVNNAIVMIDYINLLRDRDRMDLREAVIKGSASRLTPILMTTLTTVLGVVPMALGIGEGGAIYAQLGQVVSGGLLTSTMMTLYLIPLLYFRLESRKEKRRAAAETAKAVRGAAEYYEIIEPDGECIPDGLPRTDEAGIDGREPPRPPAHRPS